MENRLGFHKGNVVPIHSLLNGISHLATGSYKGSLGNVAYLHENFRRSIQNGIQREA